jgi:hypothetical protein
VTVFEIAAAWLDAGGNPRAVVDAVCVALAESGGDPAHTGPSGQVGVFGVWYPPGSSRLSPDLDLRAIPANAAAAVELSRNGSTWQAWRSAWSDPQAKAGPGAIAHPQPGSPAASELWFVRALLGAPALPMAGTAAAVTQRPPVDASAMIGAGPADSATAPATDSTDPQTAVMNQWGVTQAMLGYAMPEQITVTSMLIDAIGG